MTTPATKNYLSSDLSNARATAFYFAAMLSTFSATNSDGKEVFPAVMQNSTVARFMVAELPYLKNDAWSGSLKSHLQRLRKAHPDWNISFRLAEMVMLALTEVDLVPARVVPSSDEGFSFYFFGENAYALLQCLESKEIVALKKMEDTGAQKVWDVPPDEENVREAALEVRDFINKLLNDDSSAAYGLA